MTPHDSCYVNLWFILYVYIGMLYRELSYHVTDFSHLPLIVRFIYFTLLHHPRLKYSGGKCDYLSSLTTNITS